MRKCAVLVWAALMLGAYAAAEDNELWYTCAAHGSVFEKRIWPLSYVGAGAATGLELRRIAGTGLALAAGFLYEYFVPAPKATDRLHGLYGTIDAAWLFRPVSWCAAGPYAALGLGGLIARQGGKGFVLRPAVGGRASFSVSRNVELSCGAGMAFINEGKRTWVSAELNIGIALRIAPRDRATAQGDGEAIVDVQLPIENELDPQSHIDNRQLEIDNRQSATLYASFLPDSARFTEEFTRQYRAWVATLPADERIAYIEIIGYTADDGSAEGHEELSLARADAVRALFAADRPSTLVITRGRGTARPAADNATREGRARNRRVEIIVYMQGGRP